MTKGEIMEKDGTRRKKAHIAQPAKGVAPMQMVEARTKYKMIPVDEQTYERLIVICAARSRKQGAQVKVWVDADFQKLPEAVGETA